jgi:CheY-like chemotaxis protein
MKILIIEDDRFYANNLKKVIENELNYSVEVVNSVEELETIELEFDLIISDIFMENYDDEYIQNHLVSTKIPLILITGFPDLSQRILSG